MKNKIILLFSLLLMLTNQAQATGKAFPSSSNQNLIPIAGVNSSDEMVGILTNSDGSVVTSEAAATPSSSNSFSVDQSSALEASSVAKASAGKICYAFGRIDSTAPTGTYYLQFINAAAVPANGAVSFLFTPLKISHVSGSDDTINYDFIGENGMSCVYASSGIVWNLSTTEFTKTISSSYVSMTLLYQ